MGVLGDSAQGRWRGCVSPPGSPEQGVGLCEPRPAASTKVVLEEGAGAVPSAPKAGGKMSGAGPEALGTDQTVSWGRGTAVFPLRWLGTY